jgi:hypothetical protein
MSQTTLWLGFHGTSVLSAGQILSSTFKVSAAADDWLGSGAYFFVEGDGVEAPLEKASSWAVSRARSAKPRYTFYSVLEAHISTPVYLDLDNTEHIAALNEIRRHYMGIMKQQGKRPSGNRLIEKCNFCNFVMHEHGVDALIRREYIKTTDDEMDFGFDGGVSNCRILCLKDPVKSILQIGYAVDRRRVT